MSETHRCRKSSVSVEYTRICVLAQKVNMWWAYRVVQEIISSIGRFHTSRRVLRTATAVDFRVHLAPFRIHPVLLHVIPLRWAWPFSSIRRLSNSASYDRSVQLSLAGHFLDVPLSSLTKSSAQECRGRRLKAETETGTRLLESFDFTADTASADRSSALQSDLFERHRIQNLRCA